ncbi:MAG: AAA family ATPase [Lachnospiraceae bacterium]|nr:AAA family ATPase [Lachnospiraceae bacterium]
MEIVQLCPKKLSDFYGISGIGKTFIDSYGQLFLNIILKYEEVPSEKAVDMSLKAVDTVKELGKKLYSINRRNRLLYMPKLINKYAFDLYQVGIKKVKEIIFKGKEVVICDTAFLPSEFMQSEVEESRYKKIVQLLREVNKDIREKGQNDLYIGYPFVIGRLSGENFDVRAPLLLFPAKIERSSSDIKVSIDGERDILFNTTLMLANFKFNEIVKPLPNNSIDTYSETTFLDSVLSIYADNDLKIQVNEDELCKFNNYSANEFPQFRPGELLLEPCAVLGKFSVFSNSIQKDFDEILRTKEINPLLNDLLVNAEDIDYHSGSYMGEERIKRDDSDRKVKICERDLLYINNLNSSQEKVLTTIRANDELVVQGPPGTGKSQTIASLIAEFASEGKNVLMVSEKKTALDVVYSRLGDLSKYALLIDDVGDKNGFYHQLSRMIDIDMKINIELKNIDELSTEIETDIARLESIAKKLYSPNDYGIEPYKLYLKSKHFDISDKEQKERLYIIKKNRDPSLLKWKYDQLEKYYRYFSNPVIEKGSKRLRQLQNSYPWLPNIRDEMTESEIVEFEKELEELKKEIDNWQRKNSFLRLFTKKDLQKKVDDIIRVYFTNNNIETSDTLINYIDEVLKTFSEVYPNYQKLKQLNEQCDSKGKEYWKSLLCIWDICGGHLNSINSDLYNEIIFEYIEQFEKRNQDLFANINNFTSIIDSLSEKIEEKKNLTRQKLELKLSESIQSMVNSKRHDELLRILNNKRKWSVNKFIEKFSLEMRNVKIWLLTPEVVSEIFPLERGIFDLVVFDEASQMYVERGIPSILRAKKVVIAGDDKQLRPSSLGEGRVEIDLDALPEDMELPAPLEEGSSLLDLARYKYTDILLNFHYRSQYEELIAFSNYAFYKGKLYVSPNTDVPEQPPIQVHKMTDARWINRTNPMEAKYIVELLEKIFRDRNSGETIGIITFNSNQRDLILDLIDEKCSESSEFAAQIKAEFERRKGGEDIGLFIKNIESVQGDERDIIIFSIGYAKNENGRLVRNFGWLNQQGGENRLNVAISRARKKIHIVTSFNPSELQVEDIKSNGPRFLRKYLEYAFAINSRDKEAAKQILFSFGDESMPGQVVTFDSDFENQVYDALIEKGYHVDTQVGIGGYRIDLAIRKNGKYILGIECDGQLYHSSKSARERDYHRQKYLESRGWNIYRIWSTNWWKNSKREISKICNLINNLSD